MAQLLYDRDSTKTHLNSTKRHMRLCRHVQGTENLVTAIVSLYNILIDRQKETALAIENRENAYDDVLFYDNVLDDRVRNAFDQCKQYDRDNPGRLVLTIIFTEGRYSNITDTSLTKEPEMVAQLVTRLESLGADHKLNSLVAYLQESIDNCQSALTGYQNAIKEQKSAEALEEIAKSNLGKQYEFNYYDSVKMFGKKFANRLFPAIHSSTRKKTSNNDEENTQTGKQEGNES